jgi:hypothetical protein
LINDKHVIPGPNQYVIPSRVNEGPKYVMGGKTSMEKKEYIPGPGQYNTTDSNFNSRMKNEPAFSVGDGKRSDLVNLKEKELFPGPGKYQTLDDTVVKRNAPKYGFGT